MKPKIKPTSYTIEDNNGFPRYLLLGQLINTPKKKIIGTVQRKKENPNRSHCVTKKVNTERKGSKFIKGVACNTTT